MLCIFLTYFSYWKGGGSYGKGDSYGDEGAHILHIRLIIDIFNSMLHILHVLLSIVHIFHIELFTSTLIWPYYLLTGFYLSDNDEEMPEYPAATANDEQLPDSPVCYAYCASSEYLVYTGDKLWRQELQDSLDPFAKHFAFATSETVSINSGNCLMQAVTNVRYIMCDMLLCSSDA